MNCCCRPDCINESRECDRCVDVNALSDNELSELLDRLREVYKQAKVQRLIPISINLSKN